MAIIKNKVLYVVNSVLVTIMLSVCLFFTTVILWAKSIWEDLDFSQIIPNLKTNVPVTDVFEFSPQLVYYIFASIFVFFIVFAFFDNKKTFMFNLFLIVVFIYHIGIIPHYYYKSKMSNLYEEYYIYPELENFKFPDKKRNLMVIYMESIENQFSDDNLFNENLIPNLSKIRDENISFSNHQNMYGTGYSLASLISTHCGIPFSINYDELFEQRNRLNNVTCISDILADNGYQNWFFKGASARFADTDVFLDRHSYQNIIDGSILQNSMTKQEIKENESSFGGLRDEYLFEYITNIINKEEVKEPFLISMFTVDSHIPGTKKVKGCEIKYNDIRDNIICTDKNVYNFLEYFKTTKYYDNTTIVVMGDHLMPNLPKYKKFSKKRGIFNMFLNLPKNLEGVKNQMFTTIDFAPTFLEALGIEIKDSAFGLGRSLFDDNIALVNYESADLMKKVKYSSKIYDSFNQGTSLNSKETLYHLGEIIQNIDIPKYSVFFAKAINSFYTGDIGLELDKMPNNDLKLELTFSAMRGYDPKLSILLNGEILEVVGYSKTENLPKTIIVNVPKTLIDTSKLLFEFSNNNYRSSQSQYIDILDFKLYEDK